MIPKCLSCRQPMELAFTSKKVHKTKEGQYRVKKYKCDLCGTEECVYADGERDLYYDPMLAKKEAKEKEEQLYSGGLTESDRDFLGLADDPIDIEYDE